jgi:CDGSH-type Zn-finger protein/uncharacterized Fe-S cluster protein YjdI
MSPHANQARARAALSQLTADSMRLMSPLGERLAELPANPAWPGVHAGMTFTMSRSLRTVPDRDAALLGLAEACDLIATRARELRAAAPIALDMLAHSMQRHCIAMRELARPPVASTGTAAQAGSTPTSAAHAAPSPAATPRPVPKQSEGFCGGSRRSAAASTDASPAAAAAAAAGIEIARGTALEIRFESKRCIHARHCVLGAPRVFLANTPGEWIRPDAVHVETLVTTALDCPSGAITYRRLDGGPEESAPDVNTLRIRENGPLALNALLRIPGRDAGMRATLCRCGQSQNKPYCDGSHVAAAFQASGEPATISAEALAERGGPLDVVPTRDGPLRVSGNIEICAGTGRTVLRTTTARLCRCGHSGDKPFCDGSHARVGFQADGE